MCGKEVKIEVGDIAISLKGHDTGRKYLVVADTDANFVLVCDGEYRKIDNPKQKRKKHLALELKSACDVSEIPNDAYIRKLLKQ